MKEISFKIILALLFVLIVYVGMEVKHKYHVITASDYQQSKEFVVDIDGIKYHKLLLNAI